MKMIIISKQVLGFAAFFLGILGLFLPILPTTPFVLLAVGCFSSAPKIQKRILKIPFIREYHDSYMNKKSLSVKTVTLSLIFLWGMLLVSGMFVKNLPVAIILSAVGFAVTIHIMCIARLHKSRAKVGEGQVHEK